MEVVILGSGTGYPLKERASPSLLVEIENENLLFDCGPGTVRRLVEIGISHLSIDFLFLTHFHVDHVSDIPALLFASKGPLNKRERELNIVGPEGLSEFLGRLRALYGEQIISDAYSITITELKSGTIERENWSVHSRPVIHTDRSIGFRIEDRNGKTVAYSGDTDYCRELSELSRDADLLILECSLREKVQGHLTPALAGRVAEQAKAKKLLLTHLYPVFEGYDITSACRKEYTGEIDIASDLQRITV